MVYEKDLNPFVYEDTPEGEEPPETPEVVSEDTPDTPETESGGDDEGETTEE